MAWIVWRRTPRGRKVAHVQWREYGAVRSKSTKTNDPALVDFHLEAARRREDVYGGATDPGNPDALLERFLDYLRVVQDRSSETVRWYRGKLGPLVAAWRKDPVRSWDRAKLETYIRSKRNPPKAKKGARPPKAWGPGTVAGLITASGSWVKWSHEAKTPIPDFVEGMKRPRAFEGAVHVLTEAQVIELLEHAEARGVRLAIALAGLAGLRKTEILRLDWSMVDLEANEIRVPGKTKRERVVPLHRRLREELLLEPGVSGQVLRTHRHSTPLYYGLRRAYARAKITYPDGRPLHVLRHSFASSLLRRGVPVQVVRDLLGHSTLKTTNKYAHSGGDARREAIAGMGT